MEDENSKNKINLVIILIAILVLIIISVIIYINNKSNKIESKLKKEEYTNVTGKIYKKDTKKDDKLVNYVHNVKNGEVVKTITNEDNNETLMLTYHNNEIKISYIVNNSCTLFQQGIYSDKDYKCEITKKTGDCKPQCDLMLKEAKTFIKEVKNTIN